MIHLEGCEISDGEVELDLTEHRVIWNTGNRFEWKKKKLFDIQQLETNPATNGMEFVLDLHDFVCCADDTFGDESVEMEVMELQSTRKCFDDFVDCSLWLCFVCSGNGTAMCWMDSDWTSYPPPSLRECRTDLTSATQAYRVGRYTVDRQKLQASLKRAEAMELGQTSVRTTREAEYTPAQPCLVVGNSSVDSDPAKVFSDRSFTQNLVGFSQGMSR